MEKYLKYAVEQISRLCAIPSPTGFTGKIAEYVANELKLQGFEPVVLNKGAILVNIGGEGEPLVLAAHIDTLGAMVRSVNAGGRLQLSMIGGYPENCVEAENCIVHSRSGKEYSGCIQLKNPAVHVNGNIREVKRIFANMELVIDEKVATADAVQKLGIRTGDFVSFDPRTVFTDSGFIKSRHLDDKAGSALLLTLAKCCAEKFVQPGRKTYLFFSVHEEVGHGAAGGLPDDIAEMLVVDMGCVGDDLKADEHMVSICAKDSRGPYDYQLTSRLIAVAEKLSLNFAVDVYPFYGSDACAALAAGYDIRCGLVGPGVAASHGYERTHCEGLDNTLKLLTGYIKNEWR